MDERVLSKPCVEKASATRLRAIVAIPVRNERERIVACLNALARQSGLGPGDLGIVLFLNNCTDGTADAIADVDMPWAMRVIEVNDPTASAGWARRNALEIASAWLAESVQTNGVLLTSDADSCVGTDWVTRNLAAIAAGADLVAGRISLNPGEAAALPARLHTRGRLESEYEALLIEIEARLDPEPGNPWPCHWSRSGATLAVRHAVYLAIGGMPDMSAGEDRAFVDAARAKDFVVRHSCDIEVVTSGRLEGRACGGVADTIRLRCEEPDSRCDDRLERVHRLLARILWRRRLRRLHSSQGLTATWRWAPALSIGKPLAERIAMFSKFGEAHAAIEAASPRLAYIPVRPKHLPRQINRAARVLWVLRTLDRLRKVRTAHPIDIRVAEPTPAQL